MHLYSTICHVLLLSCSLYHIMQFYDVLLLLTSRYYAGFLHFDPFDVPFHKDVKLHCIVKLIYFKHRYFFG